MNTISPSDYERLGYDPDFEANAEPDSDYGTNTDYEESSNSTSDAPTSDDEW